MASIIEVTNDKLKEFKILFLNLINIIRLNLVQLASATLIAFLIGFFYSFTLTPKFSVVATINQNDELNSGGISRTNSLLSGILYDEIGDGDFDNLFVTMFSTTAAQKMWDKGYAELLYKNNYDESQNKYLRSPTRWESIGSFVLGYELDLEITPKNLKSHMKGIISHGKDPDYPGTQWLRIETNKPAFYQQLMNDLLIASDNLIKEQKLDYAKNQITYLEQQLREAGDVEVQATIIDTMKSKYLSIAMLSNDLPYSFKITDPPEISSNPISPNLRFIYYFFAFMGFSIILIRAIAKEIFKD